MSTTQTLTLQAFGEDLGLLEKDLANLKYADVLREILPDVQSGIALNFAQAKSPEGQAWAPRKSGGSHPLLILTGEMYSSVVEEGQNGTVEITDDALLIATADHKAPFHENGTSRMAARPFMGLGQEALGNLDDAIADAILDELGVG